MGDPTSWNDIASYWRGRHDAAVARAEAAEVERDRALDQLDRMNEAMSLIDFDTAEDNELRDRLVEGSRAYAAALRAHEEAENDD